MYPITVELSGDSFAGLNTLDEQQLPLIKQAAKKALNKTARWLRTYLAEEVAEELELTATVVKRGIVVIGAKQSDLTATLGLSKKSGTLSMIKTGSASQVGDGTQVGDRFFKGHFIATMPNGHRGIFQRKGDERLPIRERLLVFTGILGEAFANAENGIAQKQLQRAFEHEYEKLQRQN